MKYGEVWEGLMEPEAKFMVIGPWMYTPTLWAVMPLSKTYTPVVQQFDVVSVTDRELKLWRRVE